MKTLKLRFIQAAGTAALLLIIAGCALFSSKTLQTLAGNAAYYGTVRHLRENPNDVEIFTTATLGLQRLVDDQNYDPIAFADALKGLPVDELAGPEGELYVSTFIVLWDATVQDAQSLDKAAVVKPVVEQVLSGIRRGITAAQANRPPPAATRQRYDWQRWRPLAFTKA
jgi:hypothetical protein